MRFHSYNIIAADELRVNIIFDKQWRARKRKKNESKVGIYGNNNALFGNSRVHYTYFSIVISKIRVEIKQQWRWNLVRLNAYLLVVSRTE